LTFLIVSCAPHTCLDRPTINVDSIVADEPHRGTRMFPVEIYVMTPLTATQKMILRNAAEHWRLDTYGLVDIVFIYDHQHVWSFDPRKDANSDIKTFWILPDDDPGLVSVEVDIGFFSGATGGNFIIVPMSETADGALYVIVRHELGHLIGMRHLNSSCPGLMTKRGANGGVFTECDAAQLCDLYDCSKIMCR